MKLKVLAIGAHTDDIEIGCGATLVKHLSRGNTVKAVVVSNCEHALPEEYPKDTLVKECNTALDILGIEDRVFLGLTNHKIDYDRHALRNTIWNIWSEFKPDIVYVPHGGVRNQDHRVVMTVAKQVSVRKRCRLFGYLLPNEIFDFRPTYYEPLKFDPHIMLALRALEAYKSQKKIRPYFFNESVHLAKFRLYAGYADTEYVEPFEIIKSVGELFEQE